MKNMENYVDLSQHVDFKSSHLRSKTLLLLPSQGELGTKILTGIEGEMLYEHRQEGQAIGDYPGIFVSRLPLPKAEEKYRKMVFGEKRPTWLCPNLKKEGVSLDKIVLADEGFLAKLADQIGTIYGENKPSLYGFNETDQMRMVADSLQIKYYGNSEFAQWAGTKTGLREFLADCGLSTPPTFEIYSVSEIESCAEALWQAGYKKLVVKVAHSTGGMGHSICDVEEVLKMTKMGDYEGILPSEFMEEEGAVVQGWIPEAVSASLATFVDFDGSYCFEGAQAHVIDKSDKSFGAVGAVPITGEYLDQMLKIGNRLAAGYVKYKAWGSHTMGMLIVPPETSYKLKLPSGMPLCIDENTRPGASTISKAWIQEVREGKYGIGWIVSKIKTPKNTDIAQVLDTLDTHGLLIKKAGKNASGIFVYNGSVLDSGYEDKFYAIAISGADDPIEAQEIMKKAVSLFK